MIRAVVLLLILILPFGAAGVNCVIACNRCKEKTKETELTEVYCAMCGECKERRKEWLTSSTAAQRRSGDDHLSVEDECPTQPPCDSKEVLKLTQAYTTRRPCPSVTPCKNPSTTPKPCCMPMYMFPMPICSMCNPQTSIQSLAAKMEVTTVSNSDPVYLYIGVPKNIIKSN